MVVHNQTLHRFELTQDGETAELVYRLQYGHRIAFLHTGVLEVTASPAGSRWRGLATLAEYRELVDPAFLGRTA